MQDSSGNTVVEVTQKSQSSYSKYRYSMRLSHWKRRQDYLVKNITNCKERIAMHKKKIEKYEEKLYEYESYMIVLNPVGDQITQVRSDAVARLQEGIQEVEEESDEDRGDGGESGDDSGSDVQSVATCDTVMQMREQVARRTGRR
jgi:hypothetical protein